MFRGIGIYMTVCGGLVMMMFSMCGAMADRGRSGHFTLWQLPSQIDSIGNSYVLRTSGGHIVVFDGGQDKDAPYLRGFLAAMGNKVDVWFLSHPHDDHAGALNELLKAPRDLKIEKIYTTVYDHEWYKNYEKEYCALTDEYYARMKSSGVPVVDVQPGMELTVDGVRFQILTAKSPEFTSNAYNESCMVVKAIDSRKSVLFLGDLGVEGGKKLLASPLGKEVKADYVQMAHHGQNGVNEEFYKAVAPKYCLWPTPSWLWNNDNGKGYNSGPWATLHTREWIEKLHVKKSYVAFEGLVKID